MLTTSAAALFELLPLVDGALSARQRGCYELADAFARAAEAILRSAFPEIGDDIGKAASRKGQGHEIGARLAQHLDASSAACVALVLTLRGARRPVVDAITRAFQHDEEFNAAVRTLCRRMFESASPTVPPLPQPSAPIEVAAPSLR